MEKKDPMTQALLDLVTISHEYGRNRDFVLADGGNTSVKSKDTLYIKASGILLSEVDEDSFVRMDRVMLEAVWHQEYPADDEAREHKVLENLNAARLNGEENKRPSVEVLVHELFEQKFVVHIHPPLINGIACGKTGKQTVQKLFGEDVLWLPETKPGFFLATALKKAAAGILAETGMTPPIIIIENHGIFVGADSIQKIRERYQFIFRQIEKKVRRQPDFQNVAFDRERATILAPALRMLLMAKDSGPSIVVFKTNKEVMKFVKNAQSFAPLMKPFSPDHVVYCRHEPLFIPAAGKSMDALYRSLESGITRYTEKNSFAPRIIAVQGLGLFAQGTSKKSADTAMALFEDAIRVAVYTTSFGGPKYMSPAMVKFILNWEAEHYRHHLLFDKDWKKMNEKITVVTGGAQGFGKGVVEAFLSEGANVIIADLNKAQSLENIKTYDLAYGIGKTRAVAVDVGDEKSVVDMIVETVLHYGGIDCFINNAGVLKAGGLDELDAASFDFVTRINYSAYFLCAKYASRPMIIQHRFNPNRYADIIQINSKSGLAGSNKNFAYAGSKFGGIGLTQSFAMELVMYNIKVNSICPGNFFDGPLWADPKKGLFVQYLKTGKVPGAATIAEVKKAYEDKVPMKRGCTVADVARAIFYLIEQTYETGQALPVTGGQIMLR